jgi:hypothetical protein
VSDLTDTVAWMPAQFYTKGHVPNTGTKLGPAVNFPIRARFLRWIDLNVQGKMFQTLLTGLLHQGVEVLDNPSRPVRNLFRRCAQS